MDNFAGTYPFSTKISRPWGYFGRSLCGGRIKSQTTKIKFLPSAMCPRVDRLGDSGRDLNVGCPRPFRRVGYRGGTLFSRSRGRIFRGSFKVAAASHSLNHVSSSGATEWGSTDPRQLSRVGGKLSSVVGRLLVRKERQGAMPQGAQGMQR